MAGAATIPTDAGAASHAAAPAIAGQALAENGEDRVGAIGPGKRTGGGCYRFGRGRSGTAR